MHKRNFVARWCHHCCNGKTISIAYYECVFVALGIQSMRMRHIFICGLLGSTVFFHIFSQTAWFSGGKKFEHTVCVLVCSTPFVWNFLRRAEWHDHTGTQVHSHTGTQVHMHTGTHVNRYRVTQVHRYTVTQVHRYTVTQVHRYTGTQSHRYTGTQSHRYTGTHAHSHTGTQAHSHTGTQVFVYSTRYSCQIFIKLEYSLQILEKYSNIKFHEHPCSVSWVFPRGRTDVQIWRS
jgi:hypothetical protein